MNKSMEQRKAYVLKEVKTIAVIGIGYFIFVSLTGLYIPCPIRLVTGFKCPGCGISHMFVKMAHFDMIGAYHENQFVFILFPIGLIYGIYKAYKYIYKDDSRMSIVESIVIFILLLFAIAFAIYRNLHSL